MTSLLVPQHGARPWLPADNVTAGEILNAYNFPLSGLIEQDGVTFLYACLLGELESQNIWAYAQVSRQEAERLQSAVDGEFAAAMDRTLANRMLVVALASDYELVDWLAIDAGVEGPLALAKRFLDGMRRRLKSMQKDVDDLSSQRELANCLSAAPAVAPPKRNPSLPRTRSARCRFCPLTGQSAVLHEMRCPCR
jgi:hypothetical protein